MKITIHKEKFLVGLVILLIIIIFFFVLNTVNAGKINWGMKIAGTSVGGLYPNEAEELLESTCQSFLKKDIFLKYKEFYWQATLEKLGVEIDVPATVNYALHKNSVWWQIRSLFSYNIEPIWAIDEEKLEKYFQENLSSIHKPAKNAFLIYDKKKDDFTITSSSQGIIINKNKLKKELGKNIKNLEQKDVELSLIKDQPAVLENETQRAYQKAKEILGAVPFTVIIIENNEKQQIDIIDKEILLDLLNFEPVLDPDNPDNKILGVKFKPQIIENYLISLIPLINREPMDAKLTIKNNKVTTFALSKQGIKLEIQDNIPILSQKLLNPLTSQASSPRARPFREIELKISIIQPKITTDSINNMGITALLAKGVSNFSGSPESRIHNIGIGAAKFNGVLIKPGEEFSFNNILGEVGPEQGYKPELVIKKDKTIPEYGGGLCQVSTTAFRAAVNAGLEITQRYPHAFPVKYYNPQGFDATVYPPFPDLKFINNTPAYILVQTKIQGNNLIFEFYGTNDNRKVIIDGPYQYDIKEDGSMKAKLTQKVYDKNNNLIIDKTFYSNYKSPDLYPIERNPLE